MAFVPVTGSEIIHHLAVLDIQINKQYTISTYWILNAAVSEASTDLPKLKQT